MGSSLRWSKRLGGLLLAAACAAAAPARGAPPGQWALLIGVKKTADGRFRELDFSLDDVRLLRRTLEERAGIPPDNILEIGDDAENKPTLDTLKKKLPEFLGRPKEGDRVIVFFSGHGYRPKDRTYLVPRDFRLADPDATGLPIAEVRKALQACKASVKFLILDCCHAGSEKSVAESNPSSEAVAKALDAEQVPGCVVLASCRANETSKEWERRQHGAFTYWLCRALEGGADVDGDGRIGIDAVNRYVYERVTETARTFFRTPQTPALLGTLEGTQVVLSLRPEAPESLCRRLAEHLDLEIRRKKLKTVGVLEFTQPLERVQGLAHATLPADLAGDVQKALDGLPGREYKVLDFEAFRKSVKGVQVVDLGNEEAMAGLKKTTPELDGVIHGLLEPSGKNMRLECKLWGVPGGKRLANPSGVLYLNEDLLAGLGASFCNADRPPGGPYKPEVVDFVRRRAREANPLLGGGRDFDIEVWTTHPKREKKVLEAQNLPKEEGERRFFHNQMVMKVRKGEEFEIRVRNRRKDRVAMTLLVDGINTLGQKRERLGQAWSWVLNPAEGDYVFDGWYKPPRQIDDVKAGQTAEFGMRRFAVADAADSVAGRQGFTDSLGLITVAFYAEVPPGGRDLGIGQGHKEEKRELRMTEFKLGRLLCAVNIRYVEDRGADK
jgi:hypothetical protein